MKLRKLLFILCCIFIACEGGIQSELPMDKRYWNPKDYDEAIRLIEFAKSREKRHPEFQNPETSAVIKKLTNHENFLVVLTDDQLGIAHRSKVASDFFNEYRDLSDAYYKTDRQDKFIYGKELIEIQKFGLELQLLYFKLGNDNIIESSDDPNSSEAKRLLSSNIRTVYQNFNNYLDFVNKEDAFTDEELKVYSQGIDKYFPKLYETFPNGNRGITKQKVQLMLKKSKNAAVSRSLENLLNQIETLSNKET